MFYFPTNFDFTLPSAPTNNTPTPPANDAYAQSIRDAMMAEAIQNNAPTPSANDAYAQAIRDAMQNNGGSATPTTTGAPVFGPQPNPNAAPTTGTNPYANPDNWDDAAWGNVLSGNAEFEESIRQAMMADAIQNNAPTPTPAAGVSSITGKTWADMNNTEKAAHNIAKGNSLSNYGPVQIAAGQAWLDNKNNPSANTGAPAFVLPTLESGFYNTLTPAQTYAIL
jgi:hypothetical protein